MDQHTQRFGLISGHLRRLVELAGWGEVPKASCSSTAHLSVGRKHFSAQLAYRRGDERSCSRADPLQQEMGQPAPLCASAAANPLPHRPAGRLAAAVDRAVCSLPRCGQGPP